MIRYRRPLILAHRYLGIALGPLFFMWFVSGIAMTFAGGMPSLTPQARLDRMPRLDWSRFRLSPSQAAARADLAGVDDVESARMLTIMGRPAYRFTGGRPPAIVFADTGEVAGKIDDAAAVAIASAFTGGPVSAVRHLGVLRTADQWTIAQRRQTPLHRIAVDDAAHTELYVSEPLAEVVMRTTRASRSLAWIAAIPHWLYFAPLRLNDRLWTRVVLWASGLGTVAALLGLVLAFAQSRVRYAGLMRWHYVSGVLFGVFALTWVFSGLLSMQPNDWASSRSGALDIPDSLSGGPLDLAQFGAIDPTAWNRLAAGRPAKEVELRRLQGEPYYVARGTGAPTLVAAAPFHARTEAFSVESIVDRARRGYPGVEVAESSVLSAYDAYYYDRTREAPLPVLRVKFDDPDRTWVYIDPRLGEMVALFTRRGRVERWLYHGLHSLDFSFWYYNRPLWEAGVIALCAGGALLSAIGTIIGLRRLRRMLAPVSR
jgi:hypothetical protein